VVPHSAEVGGGSARRDGRGEAAVLGKYQGERKGCDPGGPCRPIGRRADWAGMTERNSFRI
jgi:hypothetical protein